MKVRKIKSARRKASHPLPLAFHDFIEEKKQNKTKPQKKKTPPLRATLQSSALMLNTSLNVPSICSVNPYRTAKKIGLCYEQRKGSSREKFKARTHLKL